MPLRIVVPAAVVLVLGGGPVAAQVTVPPTEPPATEPPAPEPTSPPETEPPETTEPRRTTSPTTRPRSGARTSRSTTTTSTSVLPTTTLFTIPGQAGPVGSQPTTTFAPVVQDDELPAWSTNLFWIGVAGALAVMTATFVLSGRDR